MTREPKGMLKICFVGCGRIAGWHAAGIRREAKDLIRVTAVVDTSRERAQLLADRLGPAADGAPVRVFEGLDEALRWDGFDAVDLMLPHHLHEGATVRCLEAGKHVLTEKPMATSVEACGRILAAAEGARTPGGRRPVFMVAEQSQYFSSVLAAQTCVREGRVGRVCVVRAVYRDAPERDGSHVWQQVLEGEGADRPWRFRMDVAGGGLVIDGGSHFLRPMRMLCGDDGDIESVSAVLSRAKNSAMDGESVALAAVRFSNGAVGSFEAVSSGVWRPARPIWSVEGTEGEVVVESSGSVRLFSADHPDGLDVPAPRLHPHGGVLRDFALAVLQGREPAASARDSLGELRAALAMYRSDRTRSWESVFGGGPGGGVGPEGVGLPRSNL
mmetsp:Transcript_120568/g.375390  ORF Transcript_120568/g.375390 Transcript_120568/m.375390 type:complete len:386 (-) Transcript_120568:103-1260(-)